MSHNLASTPIDWRLVQLKNDACFLRHLALQSSDTDAVIIQKLLRTDAESRGRVISFLAKAAPFMARVVYVATLSPVPVEDLRRGLPCLVDIDTEHRCNVLTKACQSPENVPNTANFFVNYRLFEVIHENPESIRAGDALLVRLEVQKVVLLMFLFAAIIFSAVCSVVAGVCRQSLDTGLGVFGAVLGVIGIVEGYLTYIL
ncbi:hypothetical protein F5Y04DRAFT_290028 [Hypomontagnella monticulosa]|nr:hypothetical protein F5Y04DRAFT_290028 [Hypomontagnella monticulosa]